jgi:hypothetical protein
MNRDIANDIIDMVLGQGPYGLHSSRAICQKVCEKYPDYIKRLGYKDPIALGDNQMVGRDLVKDACAFLGLDWTEYL